MTGGAHLISDAENVFDNCKQSNNRIQPSNNRPESNMKIKEIESIVDDLNSKSIQLEPDSLTSDESNNIKLEINNILLRKENHHSAGGYSLQNFKRQALACSKKFTGFRQIHNKSRFRLIHKNGESNVNRINIPSRSRKYIADLFTTLIDMKWSFVLIIFILSYLFSWLLFALFWYLIQLMQADCVTNLNTHNIISSILFSIETQQTIGYGSRHINDSCELGTLLIMIQSCFSVLLQSFMGGIVFAKLSIPKKRTETLIFSKSAVISLRDGQYCLMCRVGDMRKSYITQASVSLYILKTRYTKEGEVIPCNVQELNINQNVNRLLLFPIIVEHIIDHKSPLYDLIARKSNGSTKSENLNDACIYDGFKNEDFEIIVILEGIIFEQLF